MPVSDFPVGEPLDGDGPVKDFHLNTINQSQMSVMCSQGSAPPRSWCEQPHLRGLRFRLGLGVLGLR